MLQRMIGPRRIQRIVLATFIFSVLHIFGVFHHIFETDFYTNFHYPYDGDIEHLIQQLKDGKPPDVLPINSYHFEYNKKCVSKCSSMKQLRLVYIIKSAPEHFDRRIGIRNSWGYERRFSDAEIRTVFLVGERNSHALKESLKEEYSKFHDIVHANFTDSYYNNTYKTMMGLQWAVRYCPNSQYYMFVDDDYYVSTKNVLRYLKHPTKYPEYVKNPLSGVSQLLNRKNLVYNDLDEDERLYSGYVFQSPPHRHLTSKWYVSLSEYPYHMWPPYVTAGAYILSKSALIDMYYSSFYVKHFRFDDIYLGLVAYKAKINPLHCDQFYFYKKFYSKFGFNFTVATHGYGDPKELVHMWNEQRSLGFA
ncbi:beta-1,3-galactosyltransferase brn [Diabrotica virgifera virgifera]|uniref:Hexosyltransferase n=1 Tax=Diabrotica virgifera virgifera TaxID=50390 RepID=A0A6P7H7Q2_DIAVI|nr:beta-1,3-galactosyltransferase brn [Diabrotica virgifera virgifera]